MAPGDKASFFDSLQDFARSLSRSSSSMLGGQPEDQLKAPVQELLRKFGAMVGTGVVSATEAPISGVGRPDIAVGTNGLLGGYVELKAPGSGANAKKFTGRNREQFMKFSFIPNLVYTDGNEWALYRHGPVFEAGESYRNRQRRKRSLRSELQSPSRTSWDY